MFMSTALFVHSSLNAILDLEHAFQTSRDPREHVNSHSLINGVCMYATVPFYNTSSLSSLSLDCEYENAKLALRTHSLGLLCITHKSLLKSPVDVHAHIFV